MAWLNFADKSGAETPEPLLSDMIDGWSIEVMPRTAAKIDNFRAVLPQGTRVYVAHIDGTPIEDMVAAAKRLHAEGFTVMPHIPARSVASRHVLDDWLKRYQGEADVRQALLLGGGVTTPAGEFHSSIQMIETGLFDKMGFNRLHIAGYPEGNKDIDRDGSNRLVDQALLWKQDFSTRTDAKMAIATQFAFDAKSVTAWADHIHAAGVTIPIHVGVAGPTKLQTLIKFAISCGVGPSLKVLQKRAMDLSKLLVPYEPTEVVAGLAEHKAANPDSLIEQLHVFPLGGINVATEWMRKHGSIQAMAAVA